jgi:hypothetical protein
MFTKSIQRLVAASTFIIFAAPAMAALVTNMSVIGGCPSGEDGPECYNAGQATPTNVSILTGLDLYEVGAGEVTNDDPWTFSPTTGFTITANADGLGGSWSITDTTISHLAFKADGYFILGEIAAGQTSGVWSTVIEDWSPDITTLICPADICAAAPRNYTVADFQNNDGEAGNAAQLSNVRAFSVVPVPAAVWLFGSALGFMGLIRRRKMS